MATLTEVAYYSRKGVNIGIIALVAIIILRVIIGIAVGILKPLITKPAPPTLAFGKLPYPNGQNNIATPSALTYTLETTDNGLPTLPATVKVILIPAPLSSFGAFDRMKTQAAKIGFTGNPKKLSDTIWEFTDQDNNLRTLDIDEVTGNFHLSYNYLSDLSLFNDKNFRSNDDLISQTRAFFDTLGAQNDELKNGQASISYLKLDSGAFVPTTSLANAQAVAVTLNRKDIDKIPVVSPSLQQGVVSAILSGNSDQKKRVVDARFFYLPADIENWATYPPIKPSDAFEQLKSGKAIFASLPNPLPKSISIRTVQLAYLYPYPLQPYLQPVLVFSDTKGFVAYVPAVSPKWLQ